MKFGEMTPAMQAKLLRVIDKQEVRPVGTGRVRKVNVRTLFATHVDLREAVNRGRFRKDLYHRMALVSVEIPPLRKRTGDLPILVQDILAELGSPHITVDEANMSALLAHRWPGNVRELRTILQAAVLESDGQRLMLEQALAEISPDAEPKRGSGL